MRFLAVGSLAFATLIASVSSESADDKSRASAEYAALSALRLYQLHHRSCERLGLFLRQIVAGARDDAMGTAAGKLRRLRGAVGRGSYAVTVAVHRDGGNRDHRQRRQPALDVGVLRIAVGEAEAVAVAVDHDVDIVRIVVRGRRPLEAGIVEMPVRRPLLP